MEIYCGDFEQYLLNNEKSDATIVFYEDYLYRIMRDFKRTPFDDFSDFTKATILQYIRWLQSKGLSASTVNKYITTMNKFFKFKNLDLHFKFRRVQSKQFIENVITETEARTLLDYLKSQHMECIYSLTAFLFHTGVRICEALKVSAKDINKSVITVTGKGKSRKVFLNDTLRSILSDYVKENHITGYLWDNVYGHDTTYDNRALKINGELKRYGKRLGIDERKLHCHSFRHLFCIRLLDAGFSVPSVASIVGHSSITTTFLYLKKSETELFEAFNKIA